MNWEKMAIYIMNRLNLYELELLFFFLNFTWLNETSGLLSLPFCSINFLSLTLNNRNGVFVCTFHTIMSRRIYVIIDFFLEFPLEFQSILLTSSAATKKFTKIRKNKKNSSSILINFCSF